MVSRLTIGELLAACANGAGPRPIVGVVFEPWISLVGKGIEPVRRPVRQVGWAGGGVAAGVAGVAGAAKSVRDAFGPGWSGPVVALPA
jgi:hypothetical protein